MVGVAAVAFAMAARALLGLLAPGVEARFSILFPAVVVATLVAGPRSGWISAALGLFATEYFFGKRPYVDLPNALSVAVMACSLALVVWMAGRYRESILARGREREEQARMQFQLFERSHGFMCVVAGPELRYEFANPAYLRLVGAEGDIVGKRMLDVLPNLEAEYLEVFAKVRRTGQAFVGRDMPYRARAGAKPTLYVDVVAEPLFAEDGSVEAVFVEGYDVTDKMEAEERLKLVAREVDHRANNLLAIIQSIVRLSRGRSVEDLQRNLIGRVDALARAHQLLSDARWRGADLRRLFEEELLPYTLGDPGRARLQGPAMALNPGEAQALAMGIHELATNAAKYGALSTPDGRIKVTWARDPEGVRQIHWEEEGGPPVTPPTRKSFGINVLQLTLRGVGGRTRLTWPASGLVCEFELPPEQPETQAESAASQA